MSKTFNPEKIVRTFRQKSVSGLFSVKETALHSFPFIFELLDHIQTAALHVNLL